LIDMAARVCIITGGNRGIGFDAAKKLVAQGYHVIATSRDKNIGEQAVQQIKNELKKDTIETMSLDLSSLASVRAFAAEFKSKNLPLHVLINNAGINMASYVKTVDGFETTFQTNHLGHFLLTNLLLDDLKKSSPSRVVVVGSSLHNPAVRGTGPPVNFTFEMLTNEELAQSQFQYNLLAYKNSKLLNVWFTYELQRRLIGTGVTVNCVTPGFIPTTDLSRNAPLHTRLFMRYILPYITSVRTVDDGGNALTNLAINPQLEGLGGKYFDGLKENKSSDESYDEGKAKKLWEMSEQFTNLKT